MSKFNKLDTIYNETKEKLKSRKKKLTKNDFFEAVSELLDENVVDQLVETLTPKRYFIEERIKSDLQFEEKVFKLL